MDYNINFKYKSGGGTAGSGMSSIQGMRSKAVQASQASAAKPGQMRPDESGRKLIDSNVKLTTAVLSLRQTVSQLTGVIKNRGLGGGPSESPGSNPGKQAFWGGATGAASVAAMGGFTGFLIQKIAQIGNSYMQTAAQQKGSAGIGGFHYSGAGAYLAHDISSMTKSYRMASGDFDSQMINKITSKRGLTEEESAEYNRLLKNKKVGEDIASKVAGMGSKEEQEIRARIEAIDVANEEQRLKSLLGDKRLKKQKQVFGIKENIERLQKLENTEITSYTPTDMIKYGTIFGVGSDEVATQAGNIKRGGGDFSKVLSSGMATGQMAEMPTFLSFISKSMEEAVSSGLSKWSTPENLAGDFAKMIDLSENKSGKFISGMLGKSASSQKQTAKGQIDSYEGMASWLGAQESVMDNFKTKEGKTAYLNQELLSENISKSQYDKLMTLDENSSFYDLTKTGGHSLATFLTKNAASRMNPAEALKSKYKVLGKGYNLKTPEGRQSLQHLLQGMGSDASGEEIKLASRYASSDIDFSILGTFAEDMLGDGKKGGNNKGQKILNDMYSDWDKSGAGMFSSKERMEDRMKLNQGDIASAALKMETALLDVATSAKDTVIGGIKELGDATSDLAQYIKKSMNLSNDNDKVEKK